MLDRKQQFYVWLTAIFVAALVTGDFIGGRFWLLFGHTLSAGIIPFPADVRPHRRRQRVLRAERRAPADVRGSGRGGVRLAGDHAGAAPAAQPAVADPG
jgi:hypothetical protein